MLLSVCDCAIHVALEERVTSGNMGGRGEAFWHAPRSSRVELGGRSNSNRAVFAREKRGEFWGCVCEETIRSIEIVILLKYYLGL